MAHKKIILGIDPGYEGAFACTDGKRVSIFDMPIKYVNGKKKTIDGVAIHAWLKMIASKIDYAVIEDVHSMPNDTVVSAFTFGFNTGIVTGVLQSLGIKIIKVKPAVWKAAMGLNRNKRESLNLAQEFFPANKNDFRILKHDGRAEAALIAVFAIRSL